MGVYSRTTLLVFGLEVAGYRLQAVVYIGVYLHVYGLMIDTMLRRLPVPSHTYMPGTRTCQAHVHGSLGNMALAGVSPKYANDWEVEQGTYKQDPHSKFQKKCCKYTRIQFYPF